MAARDNPPDANADPPITAGSPTGGRQQLADPSTQQQGRVAEFGAIVIAGFLASVVLLYAFAWLADQVLEQETQTVDQAALAFLQRFSSPELTLAAQVLSLMGSEAVWIIGAVLLAAFVWQRRFGAAVTLVLVAAGAQALNDILKVLFHRARPEPLIGLISAQSFSFPSGHAMVSAAFYYYVAYLAWPLVQSWWRGVVIAALVVLVLLIGLARLYLAAHYLSDVVAGYVAGFLWTNAVIIGGRVRSVRGRQHQATTETGCTASSRM